MDQQLTLFKNKEKALTPLLSKRKAPVTRRLQAGSLSLLKGLQDLGQYMLNTMGGGKEYKAIDIKGMGLLARLYGEQASRASFMVTFLSELYCALK